ncbi:MAG: hypothetical protein ACOWWH_00470 [Eubacteriaceae bacterium]
MKDLIKDQIIQTKDNIIHLSKNLFKNEKDGMKIIKQSFDNYKIVNEEIKYKDMSILSSYVKNGNGPKIILPYLLNQDDALIKRWKISMITPIIIRTAIALNNISDKLNGEIIMLGFSENCYSYLLENPPILNNCISCIFLNSNENTCESGSSMSVKTINITFENTHSNQDSSFLRCSNSLDALINFINTINLFHLNLASDTFIRYIIHETGDNPLQLPKHTQITLSVSSPNNALSEIIVNKILEISKNVSANFNVAIKYNITNPTYPAFKTNNALNRLFCHNLKEQGFIEINSSKFNDSSLLVSDISYLVPCIYPTIGLKGEHLNEDINNKVNGLFSNKSIDTIVDASTACACTIIDILSNNEIAKNIKRDFNS